MDNAMKTLVITLMTLSLFACGEKSVMDDVGDTIDDAADEAGDAIDDAADEIDDAID